MRLSHLGILAAVATFSPLAPAALADDGGGPGVTSKPAAEAIAKPPHDSAAPPKPVDRSGHRQNGAASCYGKHFSHKKTASGEPLDPNKKTAASKTLPISTKAEVVNTETGKSTEVVVTDRGPYVKDRIIDVTPKAAEELGMKKDGVTQVEVKPVEVPATKEQEKAAVQNPPQ